MTGTDPSQLDVPSTRELLDQWITALTLLGDPARTEDLDEFNRLVGQHTFDIQLETAVSRRDQEKLAAFTAAIAEVLVRKITIHWMIDERLMAQVNEATGRSRAEILQRLALDFTDG